LEAIDILLAEELTLRENSRIKTALRMGRLATIKTLAGFEFSFQPSLDRDRILALAQLGFIARGEIVHFLGPLGPASQCRVSGGRGPDLLSVPSSLRRVCRHCRSQTAC
jgi:hypothetical protein